MIMVTVLIHNLRDSTSETKAVTIAFSEDRMRLDTPLLTSRLVGSSAVDCCRLMMKASWLVAVFARNFAMFVNAPTIQELFPKPIFSFFLRKVRVTRLWNSY